MTPMSDVTEELSNVAVKSFSRSERSKFPLSTILSHIVHLFKICSVIFLYFCMKLPRMVLMNCGQPRWLSGLRRSRVHSLVIARRSLCPEKLGSNPGQGSKGINFSGWHGLDMSITVTKRR